MCFYTFLALYSSSCLGHHKCFWPGKLAVACKYQTISRLYLYSYLLHRSVLIFTMTGCYDKGQKPTLKQSVRIFFFLIVCQNFTDRYYGIVWQFPRAADSVVNHSLWFTCLLNAQGNFYLIIFFPCYKHGYLVWTVNHIFYGKLILALWSHFKQIHQFWEETHLILCSSNLACRYNLPVIINDLIAGESKFTGLFYMPLK